MAEKNQKNGSSEKPWKIQPESKHAGKNGKSKKRLPRGVRIALYIVAGILLLAILAGVGAALWANHYMDKNPEQRVDSDKLSISTDMFDFEGELPDLENAVGRKSGFYNILVIGRDKVALNTDVILCASFDVTESKAATVQIPRDSYVKDKNGNTSKINAVFARGYTAARQELNRLKKNASGKSDEELQKLCDDSSLDVELSELKAFLDGTTKQDSLCTRFGIELLQETISRTFGIYFDYYAVVSTDAFVKIVDAVGGVDVYVQENMDYEDPVQDLYIHIKKGQQHLDGKTAEGFVRFRYGYAQADIARLDAQKIFLTAFFKKLVSFSSITKVDNILKAVYDCVDTDMSLENALGFVKPALNVDLSGITMLNMQGTPYNNGMYYSLNKADNLKIVNEYFNIFTRPLGENAVQVEELVQSTASSDESFGHTMEDVDDNKLTLGFIHRNPQSSSGQGTSTSTPASTTVPTDPDSDSDAEQTTGSDNDGETQDDPNDNDDSDSAPNDDLDAPSDEENEIKNESGNGSDNTDGSTVLDPDGISGSESGDTPANGSDNTSGDSNDSNGANGSSNPDSTDSTVKTDAENGGTVAPPPPSN